MAEHDFRRSALNPSHTLIECRTIADGLYQVTGQGDGIQPGDTLICTVKGSRDLPLPLRVGKVRYLINLAGQWTATPAAGSAAHSTSVSRWLAWLAKEIRCADEGVAPIQRARAPTRKRVAPNSSDAMVIADLRRPASGVARWSPACQHRCAS